MGSMRRKQERASEGQQGAILLLNWDAEPEGCAPIPINNI